MSKIDRFRVRKLRQLQATMSDNYHSIDGRDRFYSEDYYPDSESIDKPTPEEVTHVLQHGDHLSSGDMGIVIVNGRRKYFLIVTATTHAGLYTKAVGTMTLEEWTETHAAILPDGRRMFGVRRAIYDVMKQAAKHGQSVDDVIEHGPQISS